MDKLKLLRALLVSAAAVARLAPIGRAGASPLDDRQNQDEETQIGQEVFNKLKARAEIVESSPLYDALRPVADAITRALLCFVKNTDELAGTLCHEVSHTIHHDTLTLME